MKKGEILEMFKNAVMSTRGIVSPKSIVEITEQKNVYISGEQSVYEYSDNYIKIRVDDVFIEIIGGKLKINTLAFDGIEITGVIEQVKYINLR